MCPYCDFNNITRNCAALQRSHTLQHCTIHHLWAPFTGSRTPPTNMLTLDTNKQALSAAQQRNAIVWASYDTLKEAGRSASSQERKLQLSGTSTPPPHQYPHQNKDTLSANVPSTSPNKNTFYYEPSVTSCEMYWGLGEVVEPLQKLLPVSTTNKCSLNLTTCRIVSVLLTTIFLQNKGGSERSEKTTKVCREMWKQNHLRKCIPSHLGYNPNMAKYCFKCVSTINTICLYFCSFLMYSL